MPEEEAEMIAGAGQIAEGEPNKRGFMDKILGRKKAKPVQQPIGAIR